MQQVVTFNQYVRNMEEVVNAYFLLSPIASLMEAYRLANVVALDNQPTQFVRNNMLKLHTMSIVALASDLNCFPVGQTTALLFDINGNPIT